MNIKPCPFCGEEITESNLRTNKKKSLGYHQCPSCVACGPMIWTHYKDVEDGWGSQAIDAWNNRL